MRGRKPSRGGGGGVVSEAVRRVRYLAGTVVDSS